MKYYVTVVFVAFYSLFSTAAANAEQVPANKTSIVGAFAVYDEATCGHIGQMKHSISRKPAHGQIRVDFERHPLESGKCAGRMGGFMVIRYTPNRGYRGKDKATVTIRYPEFIGSSYMRAKPYRFNFDVK